MIRHLTAAVLTCTLLSSLSAFADSPPVHLRSSTPEDIQAITQVTQDFQAAVRSKDLKMLSSLMLNSKIMFESPSSPEMVKNVREKFDASFDGTATGSYANFAQFIGSEKGALDEKFSNIQITQDGHIAWVMFDYEFLLNDQVQNYGVETWQMMKTSEGKWKILSVLWTTHLMPKPVESSAK
ncbi:nuclear transport factor 2 family protein [Undibacterium sp. 5I1]|uniref:YybH family protein n=1 Tax=unclassified Undibacterium TaxID=2630295 RepID=UPI002AB50EE7|nr:MULTISPECIES: nuclear transport factor 2 family protein [unclassified Undibacterium]MDY7537718.1 nuclear transport factor 2 family protein [Undibacterium sp. 5I1]MEB0230210.1 nuclear transport factor 2 family protein [Undibacterium sp. 10I3]MEB0256455.1 nuclear transport factor 2 family protein [Undibacterium sp. 5I1]